MALFNHHSFELSPEPAHGPSGAAPAPSERWKPGSPGREQGLGDLPRKRLSSAAPAQSPALEIS